MLCFQNCNWCTLHPAEIYSVTITLKQILLGIQDLLDNPNNNDPAQSEASVMLRENPEAYNKKILEQAKVFTAKYE